jgi:hypothetical protein
LSDLERAELRSSSSSIVTKDVQGDDLIVELKNLLQTSRIIGHNGCS